MRSIVWVSASVLAAFALLFTTTFTFVGAGDNLSLLGATFMSGKGVMVTFHLPRNYDPSGSSGPLSVDGTTYKLVCSLNNKDDLACLADTGKGVIGLPATAEVDGRSFSFVIKEPRYCYGVFDWLPQAGLPWATIGTHCQDDRAGKGDLIRFFAPAFNFTYTYEYNIDNSGYNAACGGGTPPNFGNGYYYDC